MLEKDRLVPAASAATLDPREVERFNALAEEWWNPDGRFRPMHRFNPVRRDHIVARIGDHFRRPRHGPRAFQGLRILDVGCGAGLLAEPLAARGATVVGIDASARSIQVARWHAGERGLGIDYRHALAGELAADGESFDVVLNTEVVEHVADPEQLVWECATLTAPNGLLVVATLNRTWKSFLLAIVGAEYVLGWLPRGTHDWRRFVRPEDLKEMLARQGLSIAAETGLSYRPLAGEWRESADLGVNYMLTAHKPAPAARLADTIATRKEPVHEW